MIETNQTKQPPQIEQPDQMEQSLMEHLTWMMEESTMETVHSEDESQVRQSIRVRQPSKRYFSDEYVNLIDDGEPQSFKKSFKEMLWMKKFLNELGHDQDVYVVNYDNQSAIHLAKNPMFHSRSKHIDIRYHWIREVLDETLKKMLNNGGYFAEVLETSLIY